MTTTTPTPLDLEVEWTLSGLAVTTLHENGHLGWSQRANDPDEVLHAATARFSEGARERRIGKGSQWSSVTTVDDAAHILNYLLGVAGALGCSDAECRAEARGILAAVKSSVRRLERAGQGRFSVAIEYRGIFERIVVRDPGGKVVC